MPVDIKTYDPNNHEDWVRRLHQYLKEEGIRAWNDPAELEPIVLEVISENPKQVESYQKGKTNVIGALINAVMKKTKNGADPKITTELLQKHLVK